MNPASYTSRKTIIMSKYSQARSLILLTAASLALTFGVVACNNSQTPTATPDTSSQPAQSDQPQNQAAGDNLTPASAAQDAGTNDNDSNDDDAAGDDDTSDGQPGTRFLHSSGQLRERAFVRSFEPGHLPDQ